MICTLLRQKVVEVGMRQHVSCPAPQDRLDAQKAERTSNPDYDKSFKPQVTKEERQTKRKEVIATIGRALHLAWVTLSLQKLTLYSAVLKHCIAFSASTTRAVSTVPS